MYTVWSSFYVGEGAGGGEGGVVWSHQIYMIFCAVALSDDHTPFLDHSPVHTGGEPR